MYSNMWNLFELQLVKLPKPAAFHMFMGSNLYEVYEVGVVGAFKFVWTSDKDKN